MRLPVPGPALALPCDQHIHEGVLKRGAGNGQATTTLWLLETRRSRRTAAVSPTASCSAEPPLSALLLSQCCCSGVYTAGASPQACTACMQRPGLDHHGSSTQEEQAAAVVLVKNERAGPERPDKACGRLTRQHLCEASVVAPGQVEQLHELPDQRRGLPGPARRLLRRPGQLLLLRRRWVPWLILWV